MFFILAQSSDASSSSQSTKVEKHTFRYIAVHCILNCQRLWVFHVFMLPKVRTSNYHLNQTSVLILLKLDNPQNVALLFRLCRAIMGNFNFLTISFVPSFIASLVAILVERPSRRNLLTLYVTNVVSLHDNDYVFYVTNLNCSPLIIHNPYLQASETVFRMAVWRKMVKPVPYGDVILFAASIASILHMYRSNPNNKDAIFSMLRWVLIWL